LQIGIEIEREGCSTKHNRSLHPLNGYSSPEDGHPDEHDLSE